MGETGIVIELWRYPASSLAGEAQNSIQIDPLGVSGDRLFGLVDVASGEIARPDRSEKWHKVPLIKTRLSEEHDLEIATPDSGWLGVPGPQSDEAVSDFLGYRAALLPHETNPLRDYDGPSIAARYKKAPIHLLTTASVARLKALHPAGDPDVRRFRPNIVVEMPAIEGHFPETEWIGKRLAVGEVEMTISEPCRRCGFTIIAQDGFDSDPAILRNLVRHNGHNFGIYCTIDQPGRVSAGDVMRLL